MTKLETSIPSSLEQGLQAAFPIDSEVPQWVKLPLIDGRILIQGIIKSSGFSSEEVLSCCPVKSKTGLQFPSLGKTPKISESHFLEGLNFAEKTWAKGRGDWPSSKMADRIKALSELKKEMMVKREIIAKCLMWEIGKSWKDSLSEFDRTIQYIDDTLTAAKKLDQDGSQLVYVGNLVCQIRRMPLGINLCMGPFNYPLNETFATLIPSLVMGNVAIVKIPRFGQLLWDQLLECFQKTLPPGVIQIVNAKGREVIQSIVRTGKIDVLAFIGSSKVASLIKTSHPQPHHFRSILGLDAKNAAVVLPAVDLTTACTEIVKGAFAFNGQRCTAIKVVFVHESVQRSFKEILTQAVHGLKVGMPWDEKVNITPLADPQKHLQLSQYVLEATQKGAHLGETPYAGKASLNLFFPTLVFDCPLDSALMRDEQFGPVLPIITYHNISQVEDYLVQSPYGMQASVFGENPQEVGALIDILSNQVCRINLNTQCQRGPDVLPFSGRKNSAEGTLSVVDSLRSFSIRSFIAAEQNESGKKLVGEILEKGYSRFLNHSSIV